MKIGVSAVQGAFLEHESILQNLSVSFIELRQKKDCLQDFDALILPGGESSVQGKLLRDLEMLPVLQNKILTGMPVLATCAGLILLAKTIANESTGYLRTLPVTVKRNAFGSQINSFHTSGSFGAVGTVPMTFIRAPYIESCSPDVTVLAEYNHKITAVSYQNQLAMAFHPELDSNLLVYQTFLSML